MSSIEMDENNQQDQQKSPLSDANQDKLLETASKDLNLSIQILLDTESTSNEDKTDLVSKIENILRSQINLCIENQKFSSLQVPTIYRIIEGSDKEIIDHTLLLDFILKSADTSFTLFKFVELQKLKEEKIEEFLKFINDQKEEIREKFLTYIPHEIIICGNNDYNQLGEKSNNQIICPLMKSSINPFSLLSYSVYYEHSVLIKRDGSLFGVGNNNNGQICDSLPKTKITEFTEFSINDSNGCKLTPVSAVCGDYYTLYLFIKSNGIEKQLVYCHKDIESGKPVFLDIGDEEPLSLFGGCYHSAAISKKGEVIYINQDSVKKSPSSRIAATALPNGEKAASVVCLDKLVIVLSSNGRVFSSDVTSGSSALSFSAVKELEDQNINFVSGTYIHCFAVNKEGRVFGKGSNTSGRLGLSKETRSVSSFTLISSLEKYDIKAAYAGDVHSLFETREGKIITCGDNSKGELLLKSGSGDDVYSPTETMITGGAKFCISGHRISAIFIGYCLPMNTPNKVINSYE